MEIVRSSITLKERELNAIQTAMLLKETELLDMRDQLDGYEQTHETFKGNVNEAQAKYKVSRDISGDRLNLLAVRILLVFTMSIDEG
jgi:hypothetical protein